MAVQPEPTGLRRPRVLVTGFGPFPGAPDNPTEALMEALRRGDAGVPGVSQLQAHVLPVEYETLPLRLTAIGEGFTPDVAVHFGLSASAKGFILERLARNAVTSDKPDAGGLCRAGEVICEGAGDLPSALPLAAIHGALSSARLPVKWSDDAGGYVCNYLFYLSRAHLCSGFAPAMAGFVHVPPLDAGIMTLQELEIGARIIVETCARAFAAATGLP